MLILHKLKTNNSPFLFQIDEKNKIIFLKSKNLYWFKELFNLKFLVYTKNFIFFKKIFNLKTILNLLIKNAKNLMKGSNQFFFFEFKILGLGYKVFKVKKFFSKKVISLKLGYAHQMYYNIPSNINFFAGKRKFFFYSNDLEFLKNFCKHLFFLKKVNHYKLKGIVPVKGFLRLKVKQKK
jgi:ribosomal protein L6P/L9E